MVYAGNKDGNVYFQRGAVDIDSGETTMNMSGPMILPGDARTTYQEKFFITLKEKSLPQTFLVEGYKITVLSANGLKAEVRVTQ